MTSKTERVRSLFEIPEKYLVGRQFDIRIRKETVDALTGGLQFGRILDIGCGDASISLPLLHRAKEITLLDLSTNMLAMAGNRIPSSRRDDVRLINQGLLDAKLKPQSFDLILCIGVLAHVDSPGDVLAEIARIARPRGLVILEFTDSFHFWGLQNVVYQSMLKLVRPAPYNLNRLTHKQVLSLCRDNNLVPTASYRYGLPPLGSGKLVGQEDMYKMVRWLFGTSLKNRWKVLGNEYIYRLKRQ
jgi:ubiquinone/menaquinone biosynthesis C-methylase UbiE